MVVPPGDAAWTSVAFTAAKDPLPMTVFEREDRLLFAFAFRIAEGRALQIFARALPSLAARILGMLPGQIAIVAGPLPIALQLRFRIVE
jgi:hypothetical protein